MTTNRGLFVPLFGTPPSAVGTTPAQGRLALSGLLAENAPGAPRSGVLVPSDPILVTGSGAGMTYDVKPFPVAINRATEEGVYLFTVTGLTPAPTTAAPASGSRIDVIYVKQNDPSKGDPDNQAVVGVVQGAASGGTPAVPAVPTGALAIAQATVGANITTASQASIVMVYPYTAARGAVITVRSLADRNTITDPAEGQRVLRLDRNNHIQEWNGTAWVWVSAPERYQMDGSTFSTTSNQVSKAIGLLSAAPTRTYATKVRVNGRATVTSAAISGGVLQVRVAVSANLGVVTNAQGKSRLSFTSPGNYTQTAQAETNWIAIAANATPQPRIWIEVVSGEVNHSATNNAAEGHLWAEVLPADD